MMKQRVRMLKDLPELRLVKRKLGPLAVGDESELWLWDAAVLAKKGIAEVLSAPTVAGIKKSIIAEERSFELSPLPDDFYNSVARTISILSSDGRVKEADELRTQTFSLLETRLPKLFRLALSPGAKGGLPVEEQFFVNRVSEVVEGWFRRLGRLFGTEEVGKSENGGHIRHAAGDEADIQKQGVPEAELHAGGTATQG